jgi:hypothetical protein
MISHDGEDKLETNAIEVCSHVKNECIHSQARQPTRILSSASRSARH